MKNFLIIASLVLVTSATAEIKSKIDLTCLLNGITPSEINNPKASDYWKHGNTLTGVTLDINEYGIHLKGAMVDKTWEEYSGDITDWWYTFKFEGPYYQDDDYHKISLNTLTGGGFFYINFSDKTPNPDYGIKCKEAVEEEIKQDT